ncbi:MAG: hypothetical protein GF364_21350 [Candidatus Lokiarchaeota archaeon]|nr:hypothetical protein [Candidatus Lokiarchaeota archaeon]
MQILKKIKKLGMIVFLIDVFLMLLHSFTSAFSLHSLLGLEDYKSKIFMVFTLIMTISFLLMYFGAKIEVKNNKKNGKRKLEFCKEMDPEFCEHQKEFLTPQTDGQGQTIPVIRISLVLFILMMLIYYSYYNAFELSSEDLSTIPPFWRGSFLYTMAFFFISVSFLIAKAAGNLTEDMMRTYILGFHVHESVLGIMLIITGVPLMATAPAYYFLEFIIGGAFVVSGIFLIGRDWQDIAKGDILVHKSKEKDYQIYVKIAEEKETLEKVHQ